MEPASRAKLNLQSTEDATITMPMPRPMEPPPHILHDLQQMILSPDGLQVPTRDAAKASLREHLIRIQAEGPEEEESQRLMPEE